MKSLIFITLISILLTSCVFVPKIFENTWYANSDIKKFKFRDKVEYSSSDMPLNIDGYFLGEVSNCDSMNYIVSFYRDGTFMLKSFSSAIPMNRIDSLIKDYEDTQLAWGRYYIFNDTIRAQWFWVEGGGLGGLLCHDYNFCEDAFKIIDKNGLVHIAHKGWNKDFTIANAPLSFIPCPERRDSTFFFKEKRWFNKFNMFYTKKMREIKEF